MRLAASMLGGANDMQTHAAGNQPAWIAQVISYQWVVQPEMVRRLWSEELEDGNALFRQLGAYFMVEQLIYTYLMRRTAAAAGQQGSRRAAEQEGSSGCVGSQPLHFINMRPVLPVGVPAEHFWSVVDVHNSTHLSLLSSLYTAHHFFSYTVKLHRKDASSASEQQMIASANQRVVRRMKAIELLTSTPLQLVVR